GVYLALKQPAVAEALLTRALATKPRNADLHALLGSVREGLGRPRDAERDYGKALELERHHPGAVRGLAALYERSGRAKPAQQLLEGAVKAHPEAVALHADL